MYSQSRVIKFKPNLIATFPIYFPCYLKSRLPPEENEGNRHKSIAMVPRLLRVTTFAMLLSSGLAASGLPVLLQNVSAAFEVLTAEACPPCELLFRNLKHTGDSGKMVQDVKVQERGEPKSGTGLMFAWASGSLIRTCDYLQQMFGEKSRVVFT